MRTQIIIPSSVWKKTWEGLRKNGKGQREAACIWSGQLGKQEWTVEGVTFLDEIHGVHAAELQHRVSRAACDYIFSQLREQKRQIVVDIHTHPEEWVGLSYVDQLHPIEFRIGLIAMVFPHYAMKAPSLQEVGVHEYLGSGNWRQLEGNEIQQRIQIKEHL